MANLTASQLAKGIRDSGYQLPPPGSPPPPFLVKPTTVARAAVRRFHRSGASSAREYLLEALSAELVHTHPSMRTNAQNTVQGLEHYIEADAVDGRTFSGFCPSVPVTMTSGTVRTQVDALVVSATGEIAGRAVYWDGGNISEAQAPIIAYPYAVALQTLYPENTVSDVCVWQARRNNIHLVPVEEALAERARVDAALARL